MKKYTCCFTGHRKITPEQKKIVARRLYCILENLISEGVTQFMAGGALGFDTMAAQCVLSIKEKYPEVKLILVLPCVAQSKGWRREDILIYDKIKQQADEVVYISKEYTKDCMFKRNRYMVDFSNVCVAYLTENNGGTVYTVEYARRKGMQVINLGTC